MALWLTAQFFFNRGSKFAGWASETVAINRSLSGTSGTNGSNKRFATYEGQDRCS